MRRRIQIKKRCREFLPSTGGRVVFMNKKEMRRIMKKKRERRSTINRVVKMATD